MWQRLSRSNVLQTHRSPRCETSTYYLRRPDAGLGDGHITWIAGFINMSRAGREPLTKPPVLVRTRKVAHIPGVRPWAQAQTGCVTGRHRRDGVSCGRRQRAARDPDSAVAWETRLPRTTPPRSRHEATQPASPSAIRPSDV